MKFVKDRKYKRILINNKTDHIDNNLV